MIGSSSNIYVSISGPRESDHKTGYRKPLHTWLISVEPHHSYIPGTSHKHHEPAHYAAERDPESGIWTVNPWQVSNEPGILGNILIVEGASTSHDKILGLLKDDAAQVSPKDSAASADDEPEHWVRRAIYALQLRQVAEHFDVDEFCMFAHGYVANRLENEAPALIAYPKIHKEAEKKSSKHRFWISSPMSQRTKTNSSGEALKYGGLM